MLKRRWYDAQQRLRNQLDRSYEARMDFSLRELEAGRGGVAAAAWLRRPIPTAPPSCGRGAARVSTQKGGPTGCVAQPAGPFSKNKKGAGMIRRPCLFGSCSDYRRAASDQRWATMASFSEALMALKVFWASAFRPAESWA